MASFRLNFARIRGCCRPEELVQAMAEFGLPETEEFGVLDASANGPAAFGTIIRKTQQAVQKLDPDSQQIVSQAVEKVSVLPFAVRPDTEMLEIYAGPASSIEQLGAFFGSCLALPTLVEPIEVDVPASIEKVMNNADRPQLKSVRVKEYAHNSFMSGPYAPKFLDTQHGKDFLEEYAEFASQARIRFKAPGGFASVSITPKATFSYSCNEDDQPVVQSLLRKLI
ncbi:MAG: hypothetical protein ACOCZE_06710 [Planctomycetota bacterium]